MLCLHNSLNHNHNFSPFNRLNCTRFFVTDYNSTTLAISRSTLFSVINRRGGKKRFQHFQFFNAIPLKGRNGCWDRRVWHLNRIAAISVSDAEKSKIY